MATQQIRDDETSTAGKSPDAKSTDVKHRSNVSEHRPSAAFAPR